MPHEHQISSPQTHVLRSPQAQSKFTGGGFDPTDSMVLHGSLVESMDDNSVFLKPREHSSIQMGSIPRASTDHTDFMVGPFHTSTIKSNSVSRRSKYSRALDNSRNNYPESSGSVVLPSIIENS